MTTLAEMPRINGLQIGDKVKTIMTLDTVLIVNLVVGDVFYAHDKHYNEYNAIPVDDIVQIL